MNYFKATAVSMLTLGLMACGGGDDSNTSNFGQSGNLQLSITDAPMDGAEAVTITFSQVTVKPVNGNPVELTDLEKTSLNLLNYTGGDSELLINTSDNNSHDPALPAGDYEWMRFHISQATITIDGQVYELEVPSGDTSGLKLNRPFTIPANDIGFYTIDFDLRHSVIGPFTKHGEQYYKLKPVLRLVENEEVGKIKGVIDSNLLTDCSDAAVYLFEDHIDAEDMDDVDFDALEDSMDDHDDMEPVMSISLSSWTGGDAVYSFGFVEQGEYTVALACGSDDPDFDDDDLHFYETAPVTVSAGGIVLVNFNI